MYVRRPSDQCLLISHIHRRCRFEMRQPARVGVMVYCRNAKKVPTLHWLIPTVFFLGFVCGPYSCIAVYGCYRLDWRVIHGSVSYSALWCCPRRCLVSTISSDTVLAVVRPSNRHHPNLLHVHGFFHTHERVCGRVERKGKVKSTRAPQRSPTMNECGVLPFSTESVLGVR